MFALKAIAEAASPCHIETGEIFHDAVRISGLTPDQVMALAHVCSAYYPGEAVWMRIDEVNDNACVALPASSRMDVLLAARVVCEALMQYYGRAVSPKRDERVFDEAIACDGDLWIVDGSRFIHRGLDAFEVCHAELDEQRVLSLRVDQSYTNEDHGYIEKLRDAISCLTSPTVFHSDLRARTALSRYLQSTTKIQTRPSVDPKHISDLVAVVDAIVTRKETLWGYKFPNKAITEYFISFTSVIDDARINHTILHALNRNLLAAESEFLATCATDGYIEEDIDRIMDTASKLGIELESYHFPLQELVYLPVTYDSSWTDRSANTDHVIRNRSLFEEVLNCYPGHEDYIVARLAETTAKRYGQYRDRHKPRTFAAEWRDILSVRREMQNHAAKQSAVTSLQGLLEREIPTVIGGTDATPDIRQQAMAQRSDRLLSEILQDKSSKDR